MGRPGEEFFDPGALDSIYASRLVKSPDYKNVCAIKAGNGNFEYSEGETTVQVDLGTFQLPQERVCLNSTAFDVCIGMNFVTQNPGVIIGCLFNPAKLLVKKREEINLVSLERRVEGLPETPNVQLLMGNKESYRLVSKIREDALLTLRCNQEVDLYANTVNAVEGLYCTMKNSCYDYSWGLTGTLWANPPWSHLYKCLAKVVLDPAKVVLVTADWAPVGEGRGWGRLLGQPTVQRMPLPDCPLYVPDGASKPLAAPELGSVISLVNGAAMQIPIEKLHELTVKWLMKMNRGWSVEELKAAMVLSSSPLPRTPKEHTNSKVTTEKEEDMPETRSNSDGDDAVRSELGYEADVNIHRRVGPKKKSWHTLTDEQQPPTCS